jgi:hypothetical protein
VSALLWVVVPIVLVGGMYWLSFRIEPHWVSKDGRRFVCNVEPISAPGVADGKAMEARIVVQHDGRLRLSHRRVLRKTLDETWQLVAKSPNPPKHKAVYVLNALDDDGSAGQLALRLPEDSRAVPVLDDILAHRQRRP